MGAVYLAKQISLDREVAVKILPRELSADPEFRASFQTEARAMARLNHPNLISIYDSGDVDGMLYIAMEYVPGKSLYHSAWNKIIDPAEASRIIIGICEGLSHAHENGIIHRDIKPANILLTPKAEPKIGDFGLAQAVGVKHEGIVMGTPGYAAPEVLTHPDKADRRSDIFAVGVMLHELLTGQKPQAGVTASSLSRCPAEFDVIIQRATHPSPVMRYPDANAMAQAIRAALGSKSQLKPQTRIAVAPSRTAGPRSIITPQAAASAPTLLTPSDTGDARSPIHPAPSTTMVAQSRKAKSSVARNLLIIAALLFVVFVVYQKLEIHQQEVAQENEILTQQKKAKNPSPQPTQQPTPAPLNPSTDTDPEPTPTRSETARESLDRLKEFLAEGSREELPLSSVRRGDQDFFYVNEPMTWDEAQIFAEEHGAFIAFPQSEDDLTFFGTLIKDQDAIWIGAGRSGRDQWVLLNGQSWPIAKTPPGIGQYATLSHLGTVRAAEPYRALRFIIAWSRDGSNPYSLAAMLKATSDSIAAGKPRYPAGTLHSGTRHFLPILRPLTLEQAQDLARQAAAHVAVLGDREENYWVKDHLAKVQAPRGIFLGGQKHHGVWQWNTKEPWTYANWAKDYPSSNEDARQLAYLPDKGWINLSPDEEADGVLLEWSKDQQSPPDKEQAPPAAAPDIANLITRCRELLTASATERDEALAQNVKTFQWDLDVWSRNLKALERNRWADAVEILKSLAEDRNKIPSVAKVARVIELEQKAFRKDLRDEKKPDKEDEEEDEEDEDQDIREKQRMLRRSLEEDEEREDDLMTMPPGILKVHNFALAKQQEILNAYELRNTKIRDAFALKIKEMGTAAQQAGQLDLVRELRDYLDATKELDSWIDSMMDPT